MHVKIYHNPRCSKSRQALALIQAQGIQPEVIDYLKQPPSRDELKVLLQRLNLKPRELVRKQEAEYKALGLDNPALSDDELCAAMLSAPKLIERPIVVVDQKAVVGRPPEVVMELLS